MTTTRTTAAQITERIVYTLRCLGALLREDDFERIEIEKAVSACLQRGFEFPADDAWFFDLSYDTAPVELREPVDDLWVATPQRNGTRIEDATEMWTILRDVFDANNAALLSNKLVAYPVEWVGADTAPAADAVYVTESGKIYTRSELIKVNITDSLGRNTVLMFAPA